MAGAIMLAIFFSSLGAQADGERDLARCVQKQLNDLGFDAGPPDGAIGPITRRAAARLLDEHPGRQLIAGLPPLDRYTSVSWCRALPRLSREAGRHRPSMEPRRYALNDLQQGQQQRMLEEAFAQAAAFYRSKYSLEIISRLDIAAADSKSAILRLAASLPKSSKGRQKALGRWADTACDRERGMAGVAFRDALFFCWPAVPYYDAKWVDRTAVRLQPVMVHEVMHILQRELSHNIVPRPRQRGDQSNMGPDWLVEGAAEVMSDHFIEDKRGKPFDEAFRFRTGSATPLTELRAHNSVAKRQAYRVANLAVRTLARRHGRASLFAYWREIGRGGSADRAFEQTFGLSLDAYEAFFDKGRQDIAILDAYVDGGDPT